MMGVQPITYRGRIVAACRGRRFVRADDLEQRPPSDPEVVFVGMVCSYASDVERGVLPGPSGAANACRYARTALIPEMLERPTLHIDRAAGGSARASQWGAVLALVVRWEWRGASRRLDGVAASS